MQALVLAMNLATKVTPCVYSMMDKASAFPAHPTDCQRKSVPVGVFGDPRIDRGVPLLTAICLAPTFRNLMKA